MNKFRTSNKPSCDVISIEFTCTMKLNVSSKTANRWKAELHVSSEIPNDFFTSIVEIAWSLSMPFFIRTRYVYVASSVKPDCIEPRWGHNLSVVQVFRDGSLSVPPSLLRRHKYMIFKINPSFVLPHCLPARSLARLSVCLSFYRTDMESYKFYSIIRSVRGWGRG